MKPYVSVFRNRRHSSVMAQFRCGILLLRVETGSFMSTESEFCDFLMLDIQTKLQILMCTHIVKKTRTIHIWFHGKVAKSTYKTLDFFLA